MGRDRGTLKGDREGGTGGGGWAWRGQATRTVADAAPVIHDFGTRWMMTVNFNGVRPDVICMVVFGKTGFFKKIGKILRQKKAPFFPVIFTEKTLFPVIFAT
jgi:hypothetical protein